MTVKSELVDWNGPQLVRAAAQAEVAAIDETTSATAATARSLAPVDTRELSDGIQAEKARPASGGASGGVSSAAAHTFPVETGAYGRPGVGMLRRARDREFPRLPERLRSEFKQRTRTIR